MKVEGPQMNLAFDHFLFILSVLLFPTISDVTLSCYRVNKVIRGELPVITQTIHLLVYVSVSYVFCFPTVVTLVVLVVEKYCCQSPEQVCLLCSLASQI